MTEVPELVALAENVPKSTVLPATVPQFWAVTDVPVQNTKASFTTPVRLIWVAVEAATVPVSTGVAYPVSEYNVMRAKKVWFVVVGFWTLPNTICLAVPVVVLLAPVAVARILPAVLVLTVHEPVSVELVNVEVEFKKPVGVVHVLEAVVQI
jgi:hypothetical protein